MSGEGLDFERLSVDSRHSGRNLARDLRRSDGHGWKFLVDFGFSLRGAGLEVAYRSCDKELTPLVNVGWKCKGRWSQPPWDFLRSHSHLIGAPLTALELAAAMIVTGRGFLTLRNGSGACDVFAEIRRCTALAGTPLEEQLLSLVHTHVVQGEPSLESLARRLAVDLSQGRVASIVAGWEYVDSLRSGRSLYLNYGLSGRLTLWDAVKSVYPPGNREFVQDFLERPIPHVGEGTMYFKMSDDGSASIHLKGLDWTTVEELSHRFDDNHFVDRLRDLYDAPPDVLCLASRRDGRQYCTAYFHYYIPLQAGSQVPAYP